MSKRRGPVDVDLELGKDLSGAINEHTGGHPKLWVWIKPLREKV